MKVAYFITLHHKVYQFRWLFEAIYSTDDVFCIHIDRKSDAVVHQEIKSYVGERENVCFLPSRTVTWGGWSQVAVELEAIGHMLTAAPDWQYFINLSGQDYPIRSMSCVKDVLRAEWPRNFIRAWPFDAIRQQEPNDPHLVRRFAFEMAGKLVRTRMRLPTPKSIDIGFKGSNWHMLTRAFCEWQANDPLVDKVRRWLRYIVSPDEVFFQALIMNSPFRDMRTKDCSRFVLWPGPKTLQMEDYGEIQRSEALFARKFDVLVDQQIVSKLADELGYRVPSGNRDHSNDRVRFESPATVARS